MKKRILTAMIITTVLLTVGCATSINSIKSNPGSYVGNDVTIKGKVILEIPIPFIDYSIFHIEDNSAKMFLISRGNYHIGDRIHDRARVIGITEKKSKNAAAEITAATANFLTEHGIADHAEAANLSKKLFKLIAAFGVSTEGSYFLISQ